MDKNQKCLHCYTNHLEVVSRNTELIDNLNDIITETAKCNHCFKYTHIRYKQYRTLMSITKF
jgi:hypothetical protein